MHDARQIIAEQARKVGFEAVGFCAARSSAADRRNLARFLSRGLHGDMAWMADTRARRAAPEVLWPDARSIVVLGTNYGPRGDPLASLARRDRGTISVYARGVDYHRVLKKRLKRLGRWMAETLDCRVKVFVDTAPVMEKPLAARAGVGWQGKHTNLISRAFGSWLFLGEVFTTLDVPPDSPETDHCGSCDLCQRACPTGALAEAYRIDPRLCISYLTIEHKGAIAPALRERMGNRIYGCDDCLAVCPWNKFASPTREEAFRPGAGTESPALADLARLDDAAFRRLFAGSAIRRTGRDRFVRNVLIAVGNSADSALAAVARERLDDASPLVRDAARWAVERLEAQPA